MFKVLYCHVFDPVLLLPLQALCTVGICGGRDLRDQGGQEEGESSAHY